MKRFLKIGAGIFLAAIIGAGFWLWTPSPGKFDAEAARQAAGAYDVRIVRDKFGVPHIFGARDADVAFGLGYAHAEDDWATIEEVLFFSRGDLARRTGKDGAITDYLIAALGVEEAITAQYEKVLSPQTRQLIDGYVAGINLWCTEKKSRCAAGAAPATAEDVVAGFVSRTPFFYGLDEQLTALFEGDVELAEAAVEAREAYLNLDRRAELGSNAMAVAPSRSADGHTRLMVNSHQPFTGPVAWYEARVKSDEGWDMIGGLFPGAPLILHGAGPDLGWAFTVNKPDLVDIYKLETDTAKNPKRYKYEGSWREFERNEASLRVKLFGPFSLPVKRPILRSVHGPVFDTPNGFFAVSFAGDGDIRAVEQWFRMNKAKEFEEWQAAMKLQAIPSFNVVYADRAGNIAYYYNAAIPERSSSWDWSTPAPGDRADLVWQGVRPFSSAPYVINPDNGYVVNANHTPFAASGEGDNPDAADYPAHYGISNRTTNRGLRLQELFGSDDAITSEEFLQYKWDQTYAADSRLMTLVRDITTDEQLQTDENLRKALELLRGWSGSTGPDNRAAALAIRTGQLALGFLLNNENIEIADTGEALRQAIRELEQGFGRIDPEWGEVNRLQRGDVDLPLSGGPDILRAIYALDNPKDGPLEAIAGDTYVLYADWPQNGAPLIQTIHQFGSATLDEFSPHYADQAPLFAREELRTPPMTLEAVLAEATADYRPGERDK